MNLIHHWLCSSAHWKKVVETYILPWTLDGLNLGLFAGTDSLYSRSFRLLHLFDTMVVVDPGTFAARLKAAGFGEVHVDVMEP